MYADDLLLYAVINNENDYKAFQGDLNNLFLWCTKWGLKINYDKCKVIHFGSQKFKFPYTSVIGTLYLLTNCIKSIANC